MHDKYSVPLFAIWPTFIVGSAGTCFWAFYEAQAPFSGISAGFYVPNAIRLQTDVPSLGKNPN
jgi:hypothetical protein